MGDRDYRRVITDVINGINRDTQPKIDPKDNSIIHFYEVVRCLRRSYFDRVSPIEKKAIGFSNLLGGLLRKMSPNSTEGTYSADKIKLKIHVDMIVDDIVMIFQIVEEIPENPLAGDVLYLNACLWTFNKTEGIIVYLTNDGKEISFSLTREKKMFEESLRRARVLKDLLDDKKIPILEPSFECNTCQYYEECYIKKKKSASLSISNILGFKDEEK